MALDDSLLGTTSTNRLGLKWERFRVKCVMFGDEEETATSTGSIRDCSVFHPPYPLLSLRVSYYASGGQMWSHP